MNIIETKDTNKIELFWDDLTEEAQNKLFEVLNGDNGNYDVFPLAVLEFEKTV